MSRRHFIDHVSVRTQRDCQHRQASLIKSSYARLLRVEALEDRTLLAVFSVNNLDDSGPGSLRQAVLNANSAAGPDEIAFSVTGTISIDSQLPTIIDDLTIVGPGSTLLTIDAGNGTDNEFNTGDGYRIFNIDDGNSSVGLNVALSGLTLTGGDITGEGGAIFSNENLTIENSTLSGNASTSFGGGISGYVGSPMITSSTISNNSANFGGGIFHKFGMAKIISSTLSGNHATSDGGAIISSQYLTVDNSTISGNSASAGAGIFNGGTATVTSSTITNNSAIFDGGGIFDSFNSTSINNTIVAGNMANSGPNVLGTASGTFNLIGNGSGLTGIADGVDGNQVGTSSSLIDAMLGPLAGNGGPTLTHSLLAGSPAIDMGDPGFAAPPVFDQRGTPFVRVVDGSVNGVRIDIGAYEAQATPTAAPGDYNRDNVVDAADYTVWRDALGSTGLAPLTGADGDGDGAVTATDYHVWRSHFGFVFTPPLEEALALAAAPLAESPAVEAGVLDSSSVVVPGESATDAALALFAPQIDLGPPTKAPVAGQPPTAPMRDDSLLLLALARAIDSPKQDLPADSIADSTSEARDEQPDAVESQEGPLAVALGAFK